VYNTINEWGGVCMNKYNEIFNNACQHIEQTYIDREFIKTKWGQVKTKYIQLINNVNDDSSFHEVMGKLLREELKLSHTDFITPIKSKEIDEIVVNKNVPEYLKFVHFETEDYLYLKIPTFLIPIYSTKPIKEALDKIHSKNQKIVLDMRLNTGGSASAVGDLLSFFVESDKPYLISKLSNWQSLQRPEIVYPQPEDKNDGNALDVEICMKFPFSEWRTPLNNQEVITNKVILLIDEKGYSCGEVFAQAMKEFNRCKLVGKTTSGSVVGASDDYDCGYNYRIMLPFVTMESAKGYVIEGRGVKPDVDHNFDTSPMKPLSHKQIAELCTKHGRVM